VAGAATIEVIPPGTPDEIAAIAAALTLLDEPPATQPAPSPWVLAGRLRLPIEALRAYGAGRADGARLWDLRRSNRV
jgi:hypothetical protein